MLNRKFIESINYGRILNFEGTAGHGSIDTRTIEAGDIFFALQGEHADGHKFVSAAIAKGAALCCVSAEWHETQPNPDLPLWVVTDPYQALRLLAEQWRGQFSIPVLGITGTNGKTTTRAMIAHVLQQARHVHATRGNLNNQLGLPLTLLRLSRKDEISVLELGTNHFGEIAELCKMARPTAGLITNIGHGHLEFFGSVAGVARAKAELLDSVPADGIVFVNMDDPHIRNMRPKARTMTFGFESKNVDYYGKIESFTEDGRARLAINNDLTITLTQPGKIPALNALAAVTVGKYYRISDEQIRDALGNFRPVYQRLKSITVGHYRVIDDSYNANPDSTMAGIDSLVKIPTTGKRILVFGDMFELGDFAAEGHRKVGEYIAGSAIDYLFAHGPLSENTVESARQMGLDTAFHFTTKDQLIAKLLSVASPGDLIYVKGSRGMQMEKIIEGLKN